MVQPPQMPLQPARAPHLKARVPTPSGAQVATQAAQEPLRHVALVGMPGVGKTSVGLLLAQALQMDFVDLDAAIEAHADKDVATLFAEQGEVMFRAKERARLREVLARVSPTVVACGGGTWADVAMQRELRLTARPLLLTAPLEVLLERLQEDAALQRRPLLHGPNPRAALERLWRSREPMHAQCSRRLDTSSYDVAEVARRAAALLRAEDVQGRPLAEPDAALPQPAAAAPQAPAQASQAPAASVADEAEAHDPGTIPQPNPAGGSEQPTTGEAPGVAARPQVGGSTVAPQGEAAADLTAPSGDAVPLLQAPGVGGTYPVYLLHEGAQGVAECIDAFSTGTRISVISDTGVAPNHADALLEALRGRGLEVSLHAFAAGEENKRLATAYALYDELSDVGHGRGDLLVSLGGGLVGDVAGFVASTYLRGVPYLQVPTSTLATVDACIGSKTGLNTLRGKNLVGSFYDPLAVIIAMPYLGTQSPRAHAAGLVEAAKVAALADAELFYALQQAGPLSPSKHQKQLAQIIGRALHLKAAIVATDMGEKNQRALLNFGHTVGHAIEVGEGFRLLHGEAVALGMVAEAEWAEAKGLCRDVARPLREVLAALGVPTDWRRAKLDGSALTRDKKRRGSNVVLPVINRIGRATLHEVPLSEILAFVGVKAS